MVFTKAHMIDKISLTNGLSKKEAAEICESLLAVIKKTLASGEDVMISRFGKFCVNQKEERKGRNPATGSAMTIRPRKVVTFKCSQKLRNKINNSRE